MIVEIFAYLHRTQKKFLQRAVELLAPNGDIVYTTTSMNPIENEAVVASILRMSAGMFVRLILVDIFTVEF